MNAWYESAYHTGQIRFSADLGRVKLYFTYKLKNPSAFLKWLKIWDRRSRRIISHVHTSHMMWMCVCVHEVSVTLLAFNQTLNGIYSTDLNAMIGPHFNRSSCGQENRNDARL